MVHEEHLDGRDHIGFVKFAKFFSSRDVPLDYFPLLAGINHEALLRRYRALLGLYRQVKDVIDRSGSEGLFAALIKFGLPCRLYDVLLEMHQKNPAANATGHGELDDDLNLVLNGVPEDTRESDTPNDTESDAPPSSDESVAEKARPKKQQRRFAPTPLTAEELALDASSPPSDPCAFSPLPEPLDLDGSLGPLPTVDAGSQMATGSVTTSQTKETRSATTPASKASTPKAATTKSTTSKVPSAIATPNKQVSSRPSAVGGTLPRRRGKIEEAPKKEDAAASGMLLFMAKSQEQTALWMSDERKRAKELRAEERRDAEERAELKETIRQDNLNQARLDRIEARNEATAGARGRG
ncbi:hypothetical protein PCASD_00430 [Puccinia coronata f. sp. avenae]|uniref:Uncharacterized protein n=1 Tax=Puccinia coronata f. sp. avenae TaxID=200324 RepID=A0A2N5VN75_9BASI|nr:hypothetical protein PCASD_00430 [Puccinia coronata f. sp. avenae]